MYLLTRLRITQAICSESNDINNLYYAMFQVALNKAVDAACYTTDIGNFEYGLSLTIHNVEIFTNYLDSHLCIKVEMIGAEVYEQRRITK